MSQDELNNPMAFPRPASVGTNYATGEEGVVVDPQKGMSLRDYFAAKADQPGYVECWQAAGEPAVEMPRDWDKTQQGRAFKWWESLKLAEKLHWYATLRFMAADAMLKARSA